MSRQLVGQKVYENNTSDSRVNIILYDPDDERWCCFIARNQLTKASAFGFLHFFHHLRDVGVQSVYTQRTYELPTIKLWRMDIEFNCRLSSR